MLVPTLRRNLLPPSTGWKEGSVFDVNFKNIPCVKNYQMFLQLWLGDGDRLKTKEFGPLCRLAEVTSREWCEVRTFGATRDRSLTIDGVRHLQRLSLLPTPDGFLWRCKPWRQRKYCCQFLGMLTASDVSVMLPVFHVRTVVLQCLSGNGIRLCV
jgi:hypothetical protein